MAAPKCDRPALREREGPIAQRWEGEGGGVYAGTTSLNRRSVSICAATLVIRYIG
jgi:hypothetical protein